MMNIKSLLIAISLLCFVHAGYAGGGSGPQSGYNPDCQQAAPMKKGSKKGSKRGSKPPMMGPPSSPHDCDRPKKGSKKGSKKGGKKGSKKGSKGPYPVAEPGVLPLLTLGLISVWAFRRFKK